MMDWDGPNAVYRAYDADGLLLYVGLTCDPVARLKQHRYARNGKSPWWHRAVRFEVEWHPTCEIARSVERAAIETEQPEFNLTAKEIARRTHAAIRRNREARLAVAS